MSGKFITTEKMERDTLDWGVMGWVSRPSTTNTKDLVVIEVTLEPGGGHNFHKHPEQEEVIYVLEGKEYNVQSRRCSFPNRIRYSKLC